MSGIRFELPEQGVQQGPTCWYYSLKHILRFHGLIAARGSPALKNDGSNLHAQWKILHRLRKAMTSLRKEGEKGAHRDIGAIVQYLKKNQMLAGVPKLNTALENAAKSARLKHWDIIREILTLHYIRTVNKPKDIGGMIGVLRANGPFYISILNSPRTKGVQSKRDPYMGGDSTKVDNDHFSGGRHAMVVYAACEDSKLDSGFMGREKGGRVYFRDTRHPTAVLYASWSDLCFNTDTPSSFTLPVFGVAVSCKTSGKCDHITKLAKKM